ncbi:MAG: hypothetical protein J5I93_18270 [Pirellulaceae bacterium]|nr:hypothetical protein [Pirellulaceae bacterium]
MIFRASRDATFEAFTGGLKATRACQGRVRCGSMGFQPVFFRASRDAPFEAFTSGL